MKCQHPACDGRGYDKELVSCENENRIVSSWTHRCKGAHKRLPCAGCGIGETTR